MRSIILVFFFSDLRSDFPSVCRYIYDIYIFRGGFCCVFCFSNQTDGVLYSSSFIIEFWFDYLYPFTWLHLNPDWLLIRCLISLVEFDGLVKSP
ncbi:unnamed protein product [Brassica napus]|uniref:(rape) hypothetical protein n=1 Tax=Brassica napus TaxID=3708 RepID=A0A816VYD5_BRANA|nr:unnamed protein product [Brassica napus]